MTSPTTGLPPRVRVLMLSSVHRALDHRIFYKEATALSRFGFEVVVAAFGADLGLLSGIRLVPYPRAKSVLIRLLLNPYRVLRVCRLVRPQVVHFHDPELLLVIPLLAVLRIRYVYDIHEDVPAQILHKHSIPRAFRRAVSGVVRLIEALLSRSCSFVVAATPLILAKSRNRRRILVQNFPWSSAGPALRSGERSGLIYVGSIGIDRGLMTMLDALVSFQSSTEAPMLRMIGEFSSPSLRSLAERHPAWDRVEYMGWLSQDDLPGRMGDAGIGISLTRRTPNALHAQPVKLFEYLRDGLAVIASDFPVWRNLIDGYECAIFIEPDDPAALAAAIRRLRADPALRQRMQLAARAAFEDRFRFEPEALRLVEAYCDLASEQGWVLQKPEIAG